MFAAAMAAAGSIQDAGILSGRISVIRAGCVWNSCMLAGNTIVPGVAEQ